MQADDQALSELLRNHGMRVTSQRVLIYRALRDHGGHVSAEDVHELVSPVLPAISQQTVYNALQLLADLGVARRVPAPGASTRFEARTEEHHHMACQDCGALVDIDVPVDLGSALAAARHEGFEPEYGSITVVGRCADCAARTR